MPAWLIWVIVIVVIVVVAAALFAMMSRRRSVQRRERAEALRQEATTQASGLTESQRQAEEARAKADLARAEAERAEARASTAEQSHQVEQAGYEDKLRQADRLDPDVNTRAKDYEPNVWDDQRSEAPGTEHEETVPRATVTEPTATGTETRETTLPESNATDGGEPRRPPE